MSKQEKCGRIDCGEYLASYANNCTLHGDSMAKNYCEKYFDEAPRPQDSSGSAVLTGCKAGCNFEMMLRRIVSAIKNRQSITYNELAIKAEDLLRREGSKNNFLR